MSPPSLLELQLKDQIQERILDFLLQSEDLLAPVFHDLMDVVHVILPALEILLLGEQSQGLHLQLLQL